MENQKEPLFIINAKKDLLESLNHHYNKYLRACNKIMNLYTIISFRYYPFNVSEIENFKLKLGAVDILFKCKEIDLIYSFFLIQERKYVSAFAILNELRDVEWKILNESDLLYLLLSDLPSSVNKLKYKDLGKVRSLSRFPLKYYEYELNNSLIRRGLDLIDLYKVGPIIDIEALAYDLEKQREREVSLLYYQKSYFTNGNIFSLLKACELCLALKDYDKMISLSQIGIRQRLFAYSFYYFFGCYYLEFKGDAKKAMRYLYYPRLFEDRRDDHYTKLKMAFLRIMGNYRRELEIIKRGITFNLSWLDRRVSSKLFRVISNIKVLIEVDSRNYLKYLFILDNLDDKEKLYKFLLKYRFRLKEYNSTFSLFLSISFLYVDDESNFRYFLENFISSSLDYSFYNIEEAERNNSYYLSLSKRDLFNSLSDGMYGDYEDFGGDLDDLDEMEGRG